MFTQTALSAFSTNGKQRQFHSLFILWSGTDLVLFLLCVHTARSSH